MLLGDYKTDPDAELERPTRVSLIDTRDASLRLVDLGTSYSFRSLGRGPEGEALVLGTDGALHVLDPESGNAPRHDRRRRTAGASRSTGSSPVRRSTSSTRRRTSPTRATTACTWSTSTAAGWSRALDLPHTPNEIVANAG